jgi:hypothetical protein
VRGADSEWATRVYIASAHGYLLPSQHGSLPARLAFSKRSCHLNPCEVHAACIHTGQSIVNVCLLNRHQVCGWLWSLHMIMKMEARVRCFW